MNMKQLLILLLLTVPGWSRAQIEKKILYQNSRSGPWSKGSATMAAFFFQHYDLEQDIKIRGVDDSLMADNIIKVEHSLPDVYFFDVTGMQIKDSANVTFYGNFRVRSYDLTPKEIEKKVISKKSPDGLVRLVRVQTDSAGRPYFNEWTNNGWITVPAGQIKSVRVTNSNLWVNSAEEKNKLIRRFENKVLMARFAGSLAGIVLAAWLFSLG